MGSKFGRCIRLITLTPSCADCLEVWEPRTSGTLSASPSLYRDWFTFVVGKAHISKEKRPYNLESPKKSSYNTHAQEASCHQRRFSTKENILKVAYVFIAWILNVKVKVKVTPEQATKTRRGIRAKALLFL